MKIKGYAAGKQGRKREMEDACVFIEKEGLAMGVLSDGVGGMKGSASAAKQIVSACTKIFESMSEEENIKSLRQKMIHTLNELNTMLLKESGAATCTWIILKKKQGIMVHIGDCRVYEVKNKVVVLSEDDTLAYRKYKEGMIKETELHQHSYARYLLQAVGSHLRYTLQIKEFELEENSSYVLMSDGVYGVFETKHLDEMLIKEKGKNAKKAVVTLMEQASERKTKDDASVVWIDVCA